MLNKFLGACFSGINLHFSRFFLFSAYALFLVFSVVIYFLNKQIIEQIYCHYLERRLNVWVEKFHLRTYCNGDSNAILAKSAPNDDVFGQNLKYFSNRDQYQMVGRIYQRKYFFLNNLHLNYPWKGEIRELENVIKRALIFCKIGYITKNNLTPNMIEKEYGSPVSDRLKNFVNMFERRHTILILKRINNNKKRAAKILNLSLSSIYRKMNELNIKKIFSELGGYHDQKRRCPCLPF